MSDLAGARARAPRRDQPASRALSVLASQHYFTRITECLRFSDIHPIFAVCRASCPLCGPLPRRDDEGIVWWRREPVAAHFVSSHLLRNWTRAVDDYIVEKAGFPEEVRRRISRTGEFFHLSMWLRLRRRRTPFNHDGLHVSAYRGLHVDRLLGLTLRVPWPNWYSNDFSDTPHYLDRFAGIAHVCFSKLHWKPCLSGRVVSRTVSSADLAKVAKGRFLSSLACNSQYARFFGYLSGSDVASLYVACSARAEEARQQVEGMRRTAWRVRATIRAHRTFTVAAQLASMLCCRSCRYEHGRAALILGPAPPSERVWRRRPRRSLQAAEEPKPRRRRPRGGRRKKTKLL